MYPALMAQGTVLSSIKNFIPIKLSVLMPVELVLYQDIQVSRQYIV